LDVGSFRHRVGGFDATDVAFGFNHAECSAHGVVLGVGVERWGIKAEMLKSEMLKLET
jgi:hypothetical protein